MNRPNRRHGGASRRRPHLLRTAAAPQSLAPLFAALATAGLRAGWLELRPPVATDLPPSLEAAAAGGAARAVTAGGGRVVALKALRGAPVLRDLLREHFAGCAVVLVLDDAAEHGLVESPNGPAAPIAPIATLAPDGDGWRVELPPPATAPLRLATADLVARMRRPRPWAAAGSSAAGAAAGSANAAGAPDPSGSAHAAGAPQPSGS